MQSGRIRSKSITASSSYNPQFGPNYGRLRQNPGRCWLAKRNNHHQWIQVDLRSSFKVTAIATQGRGNVDQWLTSYWIFYSVDLIHFAPFREWGKNKVRLNCFSIFYGLHSISGR